MGHEMRRLWTRAVLAGIVLSGCLVGQNAGMRVCAGCHRGIWESYRKTGMGRSFYRPAPEKIGGDLRAGSTYYHAASQSYFAMVERDGVFYQQRWQVDGAGQRVNRMEKRVDWVMGSGNHAKTYLSRTADGRLMELPLGWYAEKGGTLGMNPGYDKAEHEGFRRPITYDCMFCHNGYPKIPAGHEKPFAMPLYDGALPEGIDCERCHGPGLKHAQLAGAGAMKEEIKKAIVNPARLSGERQMEICIGCHLEATSFPLPNALMRYDRGPFSFQPGEALGDFLLNFDHAPGTGREEKFEIVNAVYRLRQSACFAKSEGKMLCTTCHNPHDIPRGEEAVRHYTAACRQCHGGTGHMEQADCTGCHMPKRRTEDVVHSLATDHRIQKIKPAGDLTAERAERHEVGDLAYRGKVVLYYPERLEPGVENELYLAVAQVKQGSNLQEGIEQLKFGLAKLPSARGEFWFELGDAYERMGQWSEAAGAYREAARRRAGFEVAVRKLGTMLRKTGKAAEGAAALERAVAMDAGDAVAWHELGLTYQALGRRPEAEGALGKALLRDPELVEAHNNLGVMRMAAGDAVRAEGAFREAVRIKPEFAEARGNLAALLAGLGRTGEAREQFRAAVRLRPGDARVRYEFAMMLGRMKEYDAAMAELEGCVKADGGLTEARVVLGEMLLGKGRAGEAAGHYREVLRTKPGWGRAELGLGAALASMGDAAGAVPHLQLAAKDSDANVRGQAAEMLRRVRNSRE